MTDSTDQWVHQTLPELTPEILADFAAPDPETISPAVEGFTLDVDAFLGQIKNRELRMLEFVLKMDAGDILDAFSGPNARTRLSGRMLVAVIWVALRRIDPNATLRDADEVDLEALAADVDVSVSEEESDEGKEVASGDG